MTAFVDPAVAGPIEEARRRLDPSMAAAIAAHATVAYPEEVDDPESFAGRLPGAARAVEPFAVQLGACFVIARWGFYGVDDPSGGFDRLRSAIRVPPSDEYSPHVTVAHPRTSAVAEPAPLAPLDTIWMVRSIAVTAWDGRRWLTEAEAALGG